MNEGGFVVSYSLRKIDRDLSDEDLLHLLRRTLIAVGMEEFNFFKGKKIDECLTLILKQSALPHVPVWEESDIVDSLAPMGETWVDKPYENDLIDNRRGLLLKSWWLGNFLTRDLSITAKMTLFWHNHFVTQMDIVRDSRYAYQYILLLHKYAVGNVKELIFHGTTNPAMLVYLNGNVNTSTAPNENYARELLELFTIGKGKDSHYTEQDVQSAAKVLSGWKDDKDQIKSVFYPELHDSSDKHFSPFFENNIIKGKKGEDGKTEVEDLINMIFKKTETARFVSRNLYRWFVCSTITKDAEEMIINPMADKLVADNFEIKGTLELLFGSEHFFDDSFRGCIAKSPLDFLVGLAHQFDFNRRHHFESDRYSFYQFYSYLGDMGMDITNPPSVAGWPAFYQAPNYHQWWINPASFSFRKNLIRGLMQEGGLIFNGPYLRFDFIDFIYRNEQKETLDEFINQVILFLFPYKLNDSVLLKIKKGMKLMNNVEWEKLRVKIEANQNDKAIRKEVESMINPIFLYLLELPEFQFI